MDKLAEKLAELEHEQWMEWSKSVAGEVSESRLARWELYWVPYNELSEAVKEQDRIWARKVLQVIDKHFEEDAKKLLENLKNNLDNQNN